MPGLIARVQPMKIHQEERHFRTKGGLHITDITDDVRLIVGSIPPGTGHAVVAVRSAGIWFILDNRSLDVVRSEAFAAFTPLYAFDSRGVRRFAPPVAELPGQPCAG